MGLSWIATYHRRDSNRILSCCPDLGYGGCRAWRELRIKQPVAPHHAPKTKVSGLRLVPLGIPACAPSDKQNFIVKQPNELNSSLQGTARLPIARRSQCCLRVRKLRT